MEAAHLPWRRLGEILIAHGAISAAQLHDAFEEHVQTGRRFGEILLEREWITTTDLGLALAEQHSLDFVDLGSHEVDPQSTTMLPETVARRHRALPIGFLPDGAVLVAVADPSDVLGSDSLRMAIGAGLKLVVADAVDLDREIKRAFRTEVHVDEEPADAGQEAREREEIWNAATSIPAVKLVNAALSQAIEDGASDIHFEPEEERLVVRARVDGVMRELTSIPKQMQAGVTSRLKIMGALDIAERRAPQDGRLFVRHGGDPVDLRIAVLPTTHGEQVVLRILQRAAGKATLEELGMSAHDAETFGRALRQPYGAIITCGPTGSGKTTTLYSALNLLNDPERVLMTIEDPVEYQIPGVAQVEVRTKSGLTFARGLRTILRSDPDVLLVGEIRDEETARIAVQAAMTGHVVLTSLHAHNAASSIARLRDMGIEPSLLAAALNCIVAQRLARRLCVRCKEPYPADDAHLHELGVVVGDPGTVTLFRPRGCTQCAGTGYAGRVALYEVMPVNGPLRSLIESSTEEIFGAAVEAGMTTLRQSGVRAVLEGVSSLEEIRRVTGDRLS